MRLLGERGLGGAAVESEAPAGEPHQPGDHAQQRGFAGAVAAGHQQGLAAVEAEIEPGKDLAPAAHASQIVADKPHQPAQKRPIGRRLGAGRAGDPDFLRIC